MNSSSRKRAAVKITFALAIGAMFSMTIVKRMILLFVPLACSFGTALAHMGIDTSEFQARRYSVMKSGIALFSA
jgi:hypothetical protein